jgi:hypothetical protein
MSQGFGMLLLIKEVFVERHKSYNNMPAARSSGVLLASRPRSAQQRKSPTPLMRSRGLWLHIHGAQELR